MKKIKYIIISAVVFFFILSSISLPVFAGNNDAESIYETTAADIENDLTKEIFDLLNAERSAENIAELKPMDDLDEIAQVRAKESAKKFGHTRPNGTRYFTIFNEFSLPYRFVGENLAYGHITAEAFVKAWMESPAHKSNILDTDFEYIGIGYFEADNGKLYYALIFYTPKYR